MKAILMTITILLISPYSFGCFGAIANSIGQGITQQFEMEKERLNSLLEIGEKRVSTEKDCREELQKVLIDFKKEKFKHDRVIATEKTKIEEAEINYETEVLKLKAECEDTANKEFVEYKKNAYTVPVNNPASLASFEQTVNKGWKTIYTNCWRGVHQGGGSNARQQQVVLLARKLKNEIEKIRDEVNEAKEALKELHAQAVMLQNTTQANCKDARDLQAYTERLTAEIHAKGAAAASSASSLATLGAVMSCMDTQNGGSVEGSSTGFSL